MRKMFRYALTGFVVASFSQVALAQSVTANPKTGDVNASPNTSVQANPQSSTQNQSGSDKQGTAGAGATGMGSAEQDKNPDSPGKGYAKGHERGKGNKHRSGNVSSQNQSSDENATTSGSRKY